MHIPRLALAAFATVVFGLSGVPVAAAAPPKCSDLKGTVDPGQMCQIQESDWGYALNISYPVDYPDQTAVVDYIKQTREGFVNVAKMPGTRVMPYELATTATMYNSALPPRGTESVVLKTYQNVGGAHPLTFYKSFNWDQGYRKPITIDNLFQPTAQPFPVIFPIVLAELQKQSGQPVAIRPEIGLDPAKYENFAITNDAVIFFFDQGVLLPEAAGAVQVSVPRGPIDSMMA
jgi:uncharacterized protein DUF3298